MRACRRRGDAPRDDDPLVCKAVPLAWPPGAEFLDDGAPLPPRASRVRAEVDALRALDAASGASPAAARLFVSLADVFVSNDVAHLVLTRGGGGARGAHRGLLPPLTLAALISRGGRGRRVGLPESQARHYAAEMALAIDYMHRHARFAHGDVKPENVLVDEPGTGHVALCDFDLAVPVDEKDDAGVFVGDARAERGGADERASARERVVFGTEEYLAPETIEGHPRAPASDWWAFAIAVYEMTHGRTPFERPSSGRGTGAGGRSSDEGSRDGDEEEDADDLGARREGDSAFDRARRACAFRAKVSRARVPFPTPEEGGPDPPVSAACRGLIRAMTRRPGGVRVRLGATRGVEELKPCGFFLDHGTRWDALADEPPPREPTWVLRATG